MDLKQKCQCPLCVARGVIDAPKCRRELRLRGFEIELSVQKIDAAIQKGTNCKNHPKFCENLKKCPARMPQSSKPIQCDCEACIEENETAAKPVEEFKCPGHGCYELFRGETWRYAEDMFQSGSYTYPVKGSLGQWAHTKRDNQYWDMKTDRSCGFEIASPPIKGVDVESVVGTMLESINHHEKMHGAKYADHTCGLHVTFDVQDFSLRDLRKLQLFVIRHQSALLGTQPAERTHNDQCKMYNDVRMIHGGTKLMSVRQTASFNHLKGEVVAKVGEEPGGKGIGVRKMLMNIQKFDQDKLVEFRFGAGTTELAKVAAMSTLLECLIEAAITRPVTLPNEETDKKKRLFLEVIKPFWDDKRVRAAWENVLQPALREAKLV